MKELKYLNKYFYKYKFRLILGIVFIILYNIFSIILGPIIRKVIDLTASLNTHPDQANNFRELVIEYGIYIIGTALISGVFLYFVRQTIIGMSRYIEFDLKNEIYAHYQSLPLSFYRKNNTGDLMARISEDVSLVRMYLGPAIMYGLSLFVRFGITIPIMLLVDMKLTLLVIIPLPILALSIYLVNNLIDKRSDEIQKQLSGLSTFIQEAFSGIRVIKAFVREEDSGRTFIKEANKYKHKSLELTTVNSFFYPVILILTGLSMIVIIYVGGNDVIKGDITYGNIAEFIFYLNQLAWP